MISFALHALALWVLSHAITHELPTRRWPKPFSCLFCFTGWTCITSAGYMITQGMDPGAAFTVAGAFWGAVLFLDALYWRFRTTIM